MSSLEFGLDTFGDVTSGPDGHPLSAAQVIRDVVEQGVLADAVGLDFIGLGEHHRPDFAISAPEVALAAIAARTKRIHVGTAVTVLSSDDPVRVYQRFATLDALSEGRAEVILGRGSFTESFPLFGYDLHDYEQLFEEKLELFEAIRSGEPVTWSGETRAALRNQRIFPAIDGRKLKAWVGVGGSPESVIRAARYGLPLMLAIIGGEPERFTSLVSLYQRALEKLGKTGGPIGVHSPGYIAETDEQARSEFFAAFKGMRDRIGAERGWPPMRAGEFEAEIARGSLYVGSPETVAKKIAATMKVVGASRFHLKYSAGALGHDRLLRCIELYGARVAPRVRELLAG